MSARVSNYLGTAVWVIALVLAASGCGKKSPNGPTATSRWSIQTSGQPILAIWGNSGSNVFAVGSEGTILHYDGTTWSTMTSGSTADLRGVWGSSGSDLFAVGTSGTVLHYGP
jgi:photosystem II stability/assembly factor-like uncharacterized protein